MATKAGDLLKEFAEIGGDLSQAIERELFRLEKEKSPVAKSASSAKKENDEYIKDVAGRFDGFVKAATAYEKANEAANKSKPPVAVDKAKKEAFEKQGDVLERSLGEYIRWVRGKLVREKFSKDFTGEAGQATDALRKFEGTLDKYLAEQLKRAAKITKPAEVVPPNFLKEWAGVKKKLKEKADDLKESALVAALKKCDSNHEMERVNPLCKAAIHECAKLGKGADKDVDKALDEFAKHIDKYDDHMFLLSRLK